MRHAHLDDPPAGPGGAWDARARGLSPIEEAFSKIKALVKAAAARTRAALDAAIAAALDAVTAADIAGWFSHAGYLSRQAA